jgi:hypothetical protein
MKKSAAQIRINEKIKFSDAFGTHTLKVNEQLQSSIYNCQVKIVGTVMSTTCKSIGTMESFVVVGKNYERYFKFKTKIQIV